MTYMPYLEFAKKVILEANKPLTIKEIYNKWKKYYKKEDEQPYYSISNALHQNVKNKPETTIFEKKGSKPAKFDLKKVGKIETESKDNMFGKNKKREKEEFMDNMYDKKGIQIIAFRENNKTIVSKIEMGNIRLFKFPRSNFQKLKKYIEHPGVYILVAENDKKIYIGESENIQERLYNHNNDEDKKFWMETLVFLCKTDDAMYNMHKYLESRLLEITKDAENAEIISGKNPKPKIKQIDKIEADNYLKDLLLLVNELGIKFFQKR